MLLNKLGRRLPQKKAQWSFELAFGWECPWLQPKKNPNIAVPIALACLILAEVSTLTSL